MQHDYEQLKWGRTACRHMRTMIGSGKAEAALQAVQAHLQAFEQAKKRPPSELLQLQRVLSTSCMLDAWRRAMAPSAQSHTSPAAMQRRLPDAAAAPAASPLALATLGFEGSMLTVRPPPAGTEWLGKSAPPDAALDDPLFYAAEQQQPGHDSQAPGQIASSSSSASLLGGRMHGMGAASGDAVSARQGALMPSSAPLVTPGNGHTLSHIDTAYCGTAALKARPRGYRSLSDAVLAATDGDVIVLLPGTHPSGSTTNLSHSSGIQVDKRVMIIGAPALELLMGRSKGSSSSSSSGSSGSSGSNRHSSQAVTGPPACHSQVVLDHRANHPLLRISHSAALIGVTIDMVGFREAVRVEGPASGSSSSSGTTAGARVPHVPLLLGCSIACSGADGVVVKGAISPVLESCVLQGRQCGLRILGPKSLGMPTAAGSSAAGSSPPSMGGTANDPERGGMSEAARAAHDLMHSVGCAFNGSAGAGSAGTLVTMLHSHVKDCGDAGVHATGAARLVLSSCSMTKCGQEGILLAGSAQLHTCGLRVEDCGGPALDLCCDAAAVLHGPLSVHGGGGGVWLWNRAQACSSRAVPPSSSDQLSCATPTGTGLAAPPTDKAGKVNNDHDKLTASDTGGGSQGSVTRAQVLPVEGHLSMEQLDGIVGYTTGGCSGLSVRDVRGPALLAQPTHAKLLLQV